MEGWTAFFQGELGAAAALAGLLFVSVSVNQARILALGRIADRGLEALALLFLVLAIASCALIPGQPPRLLGGEIAGLALLTLALLIPVERGYLRPLEPAHRARAVLTARLNRLSLAMVALAGLILAWRADWTGLYLLAAGILLIFLAAGLSAWVLLVEINR